MRFGFIAVAFLVIGAVSSLKAEELRFCFLKIELKAEVKGKVLDLTPTSLSTLPSSYGGLVLTSGNGNESYAIKVKFSHEAKPRMLDIEAIPMFATHGNAEEEKLPNSFRVNAVIPFHERAVESLSLIENGKETPIKVSSDLICRK